MAALAGPDAAGLHPHRPRPTRDAEIVGSEPQGVEEATAAETIAVVGADAAGGVSCDFG
ncbi:MAG UNVERIFIED_CONTAM: hypothetical protein LVR18_21600 [Planctomycetaceae bacterium]